MSDRELPCITWLQADRDLDLRSGRSLSSLRDLRPLWDRLARSSDNLYAGYQSPDWWECLLASRERQELALGLFREENSSIAGVVPVEVCQVPLEFSFASRTFFRLRLRCVSVLGGQPLIPPSPSAHRRLFESLHETHPDCAGIYLKSVPRGSPCWSYLEQAAACDDAPFFVYRPEGIRTIRSVRLPATFEEYLAKFNRKKRYNLKRQARLLQEHAAGPVRLARIIREDQVEQFCDMACRIVHQAGNPQGTCGYCENAWRAGRQSCSGPQSCANPQRHARIQDLQCAARRGLLHCYLLEAGADPCAYVLGYRFGSVYHYSDIAYAQAFARFTPGTTLLYLLIQELIEEGSVRRVNLGISDADYKRWMANECNVEAPYLLLRKTWANRMACGNHTLWNRMRNLARRLARSPSGAPDPSEP